MQPTYADISLLIDRATQRVDRAAEHAAARTR